MQFFGIRLFTTWVVSCCCGNSSKTVKSTTLITYYGRLTKQTRTAASSNLVFNFFKKRRRRKKLAKSLLSRMVSLIDTARLCHFLKRKYLITVSWSANLCIPYISLHTWLANIFLMILFFTSSLATNPTKRLQPLFVIRFSKRFFFAHWQVPKPWIISALHKDKLQIQTDRHFYALITYALGALSDILDQ